MREQAVLVDSSFYIDGLRTRQNVIKIISDLGLSMELVVCGVVRCEVGRGLRDQKVREAFYRMWNAMNQVSTDAALWQEAEELAWSLDRQGLVLPLGDVVIACCAARVDAMILTHDRHFSQIPGCRVAFSLADLD